MYIIDIKELQKLLDNTIKTITENGCYIKDNKVIENTKVYVISVSGIFYDEYMGDSDWRYREISGDIIITEKQANKLINQIVDCSSIKDEDSLIEVSKLLSSILGENDSSFTRLYCTECAEFYNVSKQDEYICFSEENENEWDLSFDIHKKLLKDIKELNIEKKFGCI